MTAPALTSARPPKCRADRGAVAERSAVRPETGGRPADGPRQRALENIASNPSAADAAGRRRSRFRARQALWDLSQLKAVRACGRVPCAEGGVGLVVSAGAPGERVAGYRGLATCGSVWACPRCSVVVGQRRATELRQVLDQWNSQGGTVAMVTLTIRHRRGQRLRTLWDAVSKSWSRLVAGRPWRRFCDLAGVDGHIRVVETTTGQHGWHVHLHVLLLLDPDRGAYLPGFVGTPEEEMHELAQVHGTEVIGAWQRITGRRGFDALTEAQDIRGFSLQEAGDSVSEYFTKASWDGATDWTAAEELALGAIKRGRQGSRTPFQVLADFLATGDADDLDTWQEYERASFRRRQMTWSRGLKGRFAIEDVSDEEAAAEDAGDESLVILTGDTWRAIRATPLVWLLLEWAETAPQVTADGARELLLRSGIDQDPPDGEG